MRRWLLIPSLSLLLGFAHGCGDPCEKLADKICDRVKDRRACEKSREDMESFNAEICSSGLEIFERMYEK